MNQIVMRWLLAAIAAALCASAEIRHVSLADHMLATPPRVRDAYEICRAESQKRTPMLAPWPANAPVSVGEALQTLLANDPEAVNVAACLVQTGYVPVANLADRGAALLYFAVLRQHVRLTSLLLERGAPITHAEASAGGSTTLHALFNNRLLALDIIGKALRGAANGGSHSELPAAALAERNALVSLLGAVQRTVDAEATQRTSAAQHSASDRMVSAIRRLIATAMGNITREDEGYSGVAIAVADVQMAANVLSNVMLKLMLQSERSDDVWLNALSATDDIGRTPLHAAARAGNTEGALLILRAASAAAASGSVSEGVAPSHTAASTAALAEDATGMTAVDVACSEGHVDTSAAMEGWLRRHMMRTGDDAPAADAARDTLDVCSKSPVQRTVIELEEEHAGQHPPPPTAVVAAAVSFAEARATAAAPGSTARGHYCDIDVVDVTPGAGTGAIDAAAFVTRYARLSRPVLLRGLATDSPMQSAWSAAALMSNHNVKGDRWEASTVSTSTANADGDGQHEPGGSVFIASTIPYEKAFRPLTRLSKASAGTTASTLTSSSASTSAPMRARLADFVRYVSGECSPPIAGETLNSVQLSAGGAQSPQPPDSACSALSASAGPWPLYVFDAPEGHSFNLVEQQDGPAANLTGALAAWGGPPDTRALLQPAEALPALLRGAIPMRGDLPGSRPFVAHSPAPKPQFYVGGRGTGAPPHVHKDALNIIAHGRKRWYLLPPARAIYATFPAAAWVAHHLPALGGGDASPMTSRAALHNDTIGDIPRPLECTQQAGDAIYVPAGWGHAVLNLAEYNVGYALEFSSALHAT